MEYEVCAKGALKLKSDCEVKKRRRKTDKKKLLKEMSEVSEVTKEEKSQIIEVKRTKAELAFQKMQEKMQKERIKQKAAMTHKQRVEEFNRHLDSLTEHFDIPKVSWTK
ncbi:protein FAM32A [Zootermopsis nevadensis]|uniref:Protein FAM32A n=1 Tax=Zootermopsis nevadensis TaxID=136037 RepID=A0A067RGH3_ZOONE|nr:protein FAM32A [Zootermopsis nevadensis]KDR19321.1 hypothetical protein L798_06118 [Zootermopsis nevadensis]